MIEAQCLGSWFMADIFISYSHFDRNLAMRLSLSLESEGYSVWYDTSLKAGDEYRPEIKEEITRSRVVVVIWSAASIQSEWVRAEASYAKALKKLVPVKIAGLSYADIPLPFGELHTEDVGNWQLTYAAVVSRFERPTAQTSSVSMAGKLVTFQLLTWFGIVGAAISIFTSASGLLNLADWARLIAQNWLQWMHLLWASLAAIFDIPRVAPEIVPLLTFIAFSAMLVVGLRFSEIIWPTFERFSIAVPQLGVWREAMYVAASLPSVLLMGLNCLYQLDLISYSLPVSLTVGASLAGVILVAALVYGANRRLECALAISLYVVLASAALFLPLYNMLVEAASNLSKAEIFVAEGGRLSDAANYRRSLGLNEFLANILDISVPVFLLALFVVIISSQPRALLKRLSFIVVGVGLLLLMNQISLLNLHRYLKAPV